VTVAEWEREPLVPVTVARKFPGNEPVQESEDAPEFTGPTGTLAEDNVQERSVELVLTESVTVPAKPLIGATVIVEVPATPTETVMLIGFAEIEKSGTPVT
jgi:hypothetical protein